MIAPLLILSGLVAGIIAGDALGPDPAVVLLATGAVVLVVAFITRGRRVAFALAALGACVLGIAFEQRALHGLAVSPLSTAVNGRTNGVAVLSLAEDPDGPIYASEALVRVATFGGRDAGGRTVLAVASGDNISALRVLDAGDRVRVRAALEPLTGYSQRLRWRHAVARLRIEEIIAVATPSSPWYSVANTARRAVLQGTNVLPATPRALLGGFLLGDTRAIPDSMVNDFRAAGLSHLLAVSGANVAFALAVVDPALRRLRRGQRFAAGIGVLVLFGTMTRWEPSVLRAAVMAGLVMLARGIGRPAEARRVLVLAMIALLALDPFLLRSVGFQLSCGACAGIVMAAAPITARLRGPNWFREALGVTAAAQVGVAPVLLTTFGSVPLVALPANLLAAPLVGPLTVWGLIASVVGGILGPGASSWLQLPTLTMLKVIELIAHESAAYPLAIDGPIALMLAGLGVGTFVVHRVIRRRTGRIAGRGWRLLGQGQRSDPARS